MKNLILVSLLALFGCSELIFLQAKGMDKLELALTPADHADYVVIGKSINTRQEASGNLNLLNTVFFAEIFQTKYAISQGGTVVNSYLTGPGKAKDGLTFSDDEARYLTGGRQKTIEKLTEIFPDDTYFYNFDTPDGNIRNLPAEFKRKNNASLNPGPIKLSLYQGNQLADPNKIDPDQDITVRWSPFQKGSHDPNNIIDDMIYVMFGNCMGREVVHSGHAFETNSLTFIENEFTIQEAILNSGQPFMLEVEHSNMETDVYKGIEIIVTYAASTFLDLRTTGINIENQSCPDVPLAFDGGATDRIRNTEK